MCAFIWKDCANSFETPVLLQAQTMNQNHRDKITINLHKKTELAYIGDKERRHLMKMSKQKL